MRLYLCEKPDQGKKLAAVLDARKPGRGYLAGDGVAVTWARGHFKELCMPEAYGEQYKDRNRLDTLPIIPAVWRSEIKPGAKEQVAIIGDLLRQASELVIATDADREGEAIARNLVEHFGFTKPIHRLWLSALDPANLRKALNSVRTGASTEPLFFAARARARADWLVGMNLSRVYTQLARRAGFQGYVSVGRVQTPTLKLVADRDAAIAAFVPLTYFPVKAAVRHARGDFEARWLPAGDGVDPEGRCIQEAIARAVAQSIKGQPGRVLQVKTERKRETPPLPYSLSTLQEEAGAKFSLGAKEVLELAQSLYDKEITSYPRSGCDHLPEEQHRDATAILRALGHSDPSLQALLQGTDVSLKSPAWDDSKAGPEAASHHAIIPTASASRIDALTDNERLIFNLIARRYIAQFYPFYEFDSCTAQLNLADQSFVAHGRSLVQLGWKKVFPNHRQPDDAEGESADRELPPLVQGEALLVMDAQIERKQTRPPVPYTEATLIKAMKTIASEVEDPKLRAVLRETAGLGTEATRAETIETLKRNGSLECNRRKQLSSTSAGRFLIGLLPAPVCDPATTAVWEQGLEDIAAGKADEGAWMLKQQQWLSSICSHVKAQIGGIEAGQNPEFAVPVSENFPCPTADCGRPMRRIPKGKYGPFWVCSDDNCKTFLSCKGGKPAYDGGQRPAKAPRKATKGTSKAQTGQAASKGAPGGYGPCAACGKGQMVLRTVKAGAKAGERFLGCSAYPSCRNTAVLPAGISA